jgi:hypothetical protein
MCRRCGFASFVGSTSRCGLSSGGGAMCNAQWRVVGVGSTGSVCQLGCWAKGPGRGQWQLGACSYLVQGKPKETMWSMEAIFLCPFLCVFCAGRISLLCVSVGGTRFLCFAPVLLRAPSKRPPPRRRLSPSGCPGGGGVCAGGGGAGRAAALDAQQHFADTRLL